MTASDPRSFDLLPPVYDRFKQMAGVQLRDRLAAVLAASGGGRAVDLGAGTGYHAELLASLYDRVVAVDISAPMLAFARQHRGRANITYQQRTLEDVRPATDGRFDLVVSFYTLHHVNHLPTALARCRELVAPGGQAILVDAVADPGLLDADGHLPRWYFLEEAERAYERDLKAGRPRDEAEELRRLKLDRAWLDHQTSDRLLTPAGFTEHYLGAFPNAEVHELYRARMLRYVEAA